MPGDRLTRKLLNSLADNLVGDWEQLAIYLGVDRELLCYLRSISKVNTSRPTVELLNRWWNRSLASERWMELHDALVECRRQDLAAQTSNYFRLQEGACMESGLQMFFQSIAENCNRDWKDLGLYLNFSFDEIREINSSNASHEWKDNSYKVLTEWNEGRTGEDLIPALEKMKRMDLIVRIQDGVPQ